MRGLCPYRVDIVKKGENPKVLYNLKDCSLLSLFLDEKLESKILDLVFNFERAKVPFFLFVCLSVCFVFLFLFYNAPKPHIMLLLATSSHILLLHAKRIGNRGSVVRFSSLMR